MSSGIKRRGKKGRSTSPFVMLHWHLLDSQGWHEISPYARLAYIELARAYNGENNGTIGMSARSLAVRIPCNKATASRALRELEDAGFIATMRLGKFTRRDRLASEYRLTNLSCNVTGGLPTRSWNTQRWRPDDGTNKAYRTGAQVAQSHPKNPSTVRANSTVSPLLPPVTVRVASTHLESTRGTEELDAHSPEPQQEASEPLPTSPDPWADLGIPDFLKRARA